MVFKEVRAKAVIDEEKKFLPQLMKRAQAYKAHKDMYEQIRSKETQSAQLRKEIYRQEVALKEAFKSNSDPTVFHATVIKLQQQLSMLQQDSLNVNREIDALYDERQRLYDLYMIGDRTDIVRVMKCVSDGCRGFLNESYQCSLCNVQVCKDCHAVVKEDHTCKQEDIDSVKLILEETRPCPSCQTNITKTDGCDQMWCTSCHTTFSWNTGRIETGRIHNPHYIAWVKQRNQIMPRELGDVPCGGMPGIQEVHTNLAALNVPRPYFAYVSAVSKLALSVANQDMRRYPIQVGRCQEMDMASIRYMVGYMTESAWKTKIYTLAKTKELNRERRLILDMLVACLIDFFRGLASSQSVDEVLEIFDQLEELREYFNESMKNLCAQFEVSACKQIPIDWCKLQC